MADLHIPFRVKFSGLDADRNELEAYSAAKSLEGLSWALSVTINFAVTGEYKSRGDMSRSARIYLRPPRSGSFIADMNAWVTVNPFLATVALGVGTGIVATYVTKLIEYVFKKALGLIFEMPSNFKKYYNRMSRKEKNDLEILIQRIEPPLSRAHTVIDRTATKIAFSSKRTQLFEMDSLTKEYIEAVPAETPEIIHTNITAYNVVSRNGRMFDPKHSNTAAFTLVRSPLKGTASTVTTSMDQYQAGRKGMVKVTVDRVQTASGRLKKFLIMAAEEIPRTDWENGLDPLRAKR